MNIDVSFDTSVNKAPSGFTTDVNYVVSYLDSLFSNNVTINIAVGWGEVDGSALPSGVLGESIGLNYTAQSYSQVVAALQAENAPGASNLAATSPLSGSLLMDSAQAKALGLAGPSGALDGYVGFSSSTAFSFGIGATPAPTQYDLVGVIEHEITEVLGRTSLANEQPNHYTAMDLFRYSAPGVMGVKSGGAAYFSLDGGVTDLGDWNSSASNGDLGDWWPSGPGGTTDAFDDYATQGVRANFSATDITLMNALGYAIGPVVTAVAATPGAGVQAAGATVSIVLDLNEAVTVTGTPTLTLNNGAVATYSSGSGGTMLNFTYVVGAGDGVVQALAVSGIDTSGGSIVDAAGNGLSGFLTPATQSGPPVDPRGLAVNVQNVVAFEGHPVYGTAMVSSLSDPNGDSITLFGFLDTGSSKGALSLNGVTQARGAWVDVAVGALGELAFVAGKTPASDTIEVEAYDATTASWSTYSTLAVTTSAPLKISNTAAWVSANLDTLQADYVAGGLASVVLTDTTKPTLTVTAAQVAADAGALGKITSAYFINASGTLAAAAAGSIPTVTLAKLVAGLAVVDTAADVQASLTGLQAVAKAGKLASITLSDPSTPTLSLTAVQLKADAGALAAIASPYAVAAAGLTAAFAGVGVHDFAVPGSVLDITDLNEATLVATFKENAAGTAATVALKDGTHAATITLFGQFMAAGYSGTAASAGIVASPDSGSGTLLTYNSAMALAHRG